MAGPATAARSPAPAAPALPIHHTEPLERIGSGPEAYSRVPPHVDAPAPEVMPPTADQELGAAKVAAIVSTMFGLALSDATIRYEVRERLAAAGHEDLDVAHWQAIAVEHVRACTHRACLKHGIALHVPYEDEVTALAAAGGSGLYLLAKMTGRLDRPAAELEAPRPSTVGHAAPVVVDDGPADHDPGVHPLYQPLKVGR